MHELGHATGHPSRLNRDQSGSYGTKKYAFEEILERKKALRGATQVFRATYETQCHTHSPLETHGVVVRWDGDDAATVWASTQSIFAVRDEFGLSFYNTSAFDFAKLLEDPEGLRANLMDYITGFSGNIDVFERFKFENELATLDEKNRLYQITQSFAEVDLHPDTVPNAEMGDLFEFLIFKFAEASNEEAGEHWTPRDAVRPAPRRRRR